MAWGKRRVTDPNIINATIPSNADNTGLPFLY